ncbi:hypothetical protein M878_09050 [Streptomyces roseochromogenus subsp. oscitans DS 12.976]|uniref:Uncharacterized protein n=1 Tax=Streptomyces roseochromogenus subsp. oscitans DS 12.976 TaxID=1352936 RepID=V6KRM5_STRRC|nr:hypothetical protein M878_09050 [Streptomyces roseochromogenus subsp. oscitans DS 12.976]
MPDLVAAAGWDGEADADWGGVVGVDGDGVVDLGWGGVVGVG